VNPPATADRLSKFSWHTNGTVSQSQFTEAVNKISCKLLDFSEKKWQEWRGSNPQPPVLEI